MPVDSEALRAAMRNWATGVSIVSAQFEGARHGMTVSSFTSVSLVPPIILVSLENKTRTYQLVEKSGYFGVTVLGNHQQEISDLFAGRHTDTLDRFDGFEIKTLVSGAPFLIPNLACFDCRVVKSLEVSTQTVVIGEVVAIENNHGSDPLIYFDGSYRRLQG